MKYALFSLFEIVLIAFNKFIVFDSEYLHRNYTIFTYILEYIIAILLLVSPIDSSNND